MFVVLVVLFNTISKKQRERGDYAEFSGKSERCFIQLTSCQSIEL